MLYCRAAIAQRIRGVLAEGVQLGVLVSAALVDRSDSEGTQYYTVILPARMYQISPLRASGGPTRMRHKC